MQLSDRAGRAHGIDVGVSGAFALQLFGEHFHHHLLSLAGRQLVYDRVGLEELANLSKYFSRYRHVLHLEVRAGKGVSRAG